MKIVIVGASGIIGKNIVAALIDSHEVITAGSKSGDLQVDITDPQSIKNFFTKTGNFDALVIAAGNGYIGKYAELKEEDFYKGIKSKMMGQINLVLEGKKYINPGGSFTLVSGSLAENPVHSMAVVSVVNAAVNAFAIASSIEFENGERINVVAPGPLKGFAEMFKAVLPDVPPVEEERVTEAYLQSIQGSETGKIIKVY